MERRNTQFGGCTVTWLVLGIVLAGTLITAADDTPTPRKELTSDTDRSAYCLAYSDFKTLAAGYGDNSIRIWNVGMGSVRTTLTGHTNPVLALAFSPDGKTLATVAKQIKLWDVATGEEQAHLKGAANSVAFSPDGKSLAAGGGPNGALILWDVSNVKSTTVRATLNGPSKSLVTKVAFSPDGKILAGTVVDISDDPDQEMLSGKIQLWNVATGKAEALLGNYDEREGLAFSPDGATLAVGKATDVELWNVKTRKLRTTLKNGSAVWSLAFSPDGTILAAGNGHHSLGVSGRVRFWNTSTNAEIATWNIGGNMTAICFGPGSKTIATAGDQTIKLWDVPAAE